MRRAKFNIFGFILAAFVLSFLAGSAFGFTEYPIGDPQEVENMEIAAVYFQPVPMEPMMGLTPEKSDLHLECDIKATAGNKVGFGAGEWIPYLTISYKLTNTNNGQVIEGTFMPMNADDGPHYGANIKMAGAGNYKVTFIIESPIKKDFMLHTDSETGVPGRFWRKPIVVEWDFPYVPRKW